MLLSGCIIVKNEGHLLEDCLKCMHDFVDEIVLVDNGSVDNTKSIAKEFGCKIIDFPEANHDGGRNAYLEAATSEWIFVLDADERITLGSKHKILEAISDTPKDVMFFRLPRYEYIGDGKWAATSIARLFRNHRQIRYNSFNVHSSISASIISMGGKSKSIYAPIHHLDILFDKRTVNKRERYIRQMLYEIENRSFDPNIWYIHNFLGVEYTCIGEYKQAEYHYKKALELSDKATHYSHIYLAQNYFIKGDFLGAEREADFLIEINSDLKDRALLLKAEIEIKNNKISNALELCLQALEFNPQAPHQLINIAALIEETDPQKAIEYLNHAIEYNPYLLNPIIYKKGETPNIFSHQTSFLSCTKNIFAHLENCWRNLNNEKMAKEWKAKGNRIMMGTQLL